MSPDPRFPLVQSRNALPKYRSRTSHLSRLRASMASALATACLETPPLVPPTVDEDPILPVVTLNGSKFHLVRKGTETGIPIIFLAGGPGNDTAYLRRLGEACDGVELSASFPLYFWDQRGSGLSRRHNDNVLNLRTFEDDLDALVDHVDPTGEGVILVGHSWGGMLAGSFLNRHPQRVRGAVLLEPGELSSDIWDAWTARPDYEESVQIDYGAEWLNDFAWSGQVLTLHDHEALDFAALIAAKGSQPDRINKEPAPNVRLGAAVIRASLNGSFYPQHFDFTTHLDELPVEVLVVAGDTPTSDLGVTFQQTQIGVFEEATLVVLPGSGHTDVAWADACTTLTHIDAYLGRLGLSQ